MYSEDGEQLAYNDDFHPCGLQSQFIIKLRPGDYFLLVEGYDTRRGQLYSASRERSTRATTSDSDSRGKLIEKCHARG